MTTDEKSSAATESRSNPGIFSQLTMVSTPVYVTIMLFAMSTWIGVVGVWVEMPLLVNALPESWNLPSYLVIIIQCANLGPASYAIWDKIRRRQRRETEQEDQHQRRESCVDAEVTVSLVIILTAAVAMLFLSIFWHHTTPVGDARRSVVLLTLVSFVALSCCTSSVVFLPYMARFPSVYISAYYFGQGLCGLIPGIVGLAQSAGQEPECHNKTMHNVTTESSGQPGLSQEYVVYYQPPRFSVSTFFALISFLLVVSAVAFCCLNFLQKCRREMIDHESEEVKHAAQETVTQEVTGLLDCGEKESNDQVQSVDDQVAVDTPVTSLPSRRYGTLLVIIAVISALWNGVLPATQTYTCLPYGNMVYRLSVCLSWVVSPLATLPSMIAPTSSLPLIGGLAAVAAVLSGLHLFLASQSPHPILQGSVVGQATVVATSVIMAFCFSFTRVSVSSVLRREGGRSQLLACGATTQLGSFCGALASFILVSVAKLFHKMPPCQH